MDLEQLKQEVREQLTRRPSDEEVVAGVRGKIVEELTSKQTRVHELEYSLEEKKQTLDAEVQTARESLAETEAVVNSLEQAQG